MDRTNVKASLRIVGECFDVQRVTDTLEVTPSRTWNKGEPPAIYFEPEFVKFAAEIGAHIDVDTYVN